MARESRNLAANNSVARPRPVSPPVGAFPGGNRGVTPSIYRNDVAGVFLAPGSVGRFLRESHGLNSFRSWTLIILNFSSETRFQPTIRQSFPENHVRASDLKCMNLRGDDATPARVISFYWKKRYTNVTRTPKAQGYESYIFYPNHWLRLRCTYERARTTAKRDGGREILRQRSPMELLAFCTAHRVVCARKFIVLHLDRRYSHSHAAIVVAM